ncbi:MAG: purine-nucleoside phosphorylase [Ignavibacteria bacterium GWB2_35_12]|nr:MAG: purine-nucleoside phosphorylase [Ignavibacteria bacterium GWB2_35_12]OGU96280.1 MAG: purine-nucleoside phosphorylase [Ignavibacteria bacterium RIFOXYA2_FULL_35_10]OGV20701.1 MAG: purine-nucleoside phosphorylase [Ignavibacteria bacterium RIFOXYC2_FULL_35_21]
MDNSNLKQLIDESVNFLRSKTRTEPGIGIILGTGLGGLAKEIETEIVIPYEEIPNFPLTTVEFHSGKLIFGELSGRQVVAMQGRFHFYEGYNMTQITFPVRVMKFLGIKSLIISNACGTVNPNMRKGEIMLIEDHINLLGTNPLIGTNDTSIGLRFPDMSEPYSKRLISLVESIAKENNIIIHKGIYAAMTGPMLETRAEYRMLQVIGADVAGMSTVPETIAARHMGVEVLGLSIISDECYPETLTPINIQDIIDTAAKTEQTLTFLLKKAVAQL